MPHATMAEDEVPAVKRATDALHDVLTSASHVKPIGSIEPPLTNTILPDIDRKFGRNKDEMLQLLGFQEHNVFELACRKIFLEVLTSTNIEDPAFGTVWNLLDVAVVLGDRDQCGSQLAFWFIEEFLESHTIEDCKKVFDYLESRREWMISEHFGKKYQIILRGCNELLRRLSHGEDTLFYGRVLIYLFRCFPLCHRSAINLRGEFNVDNTTVYDSLPAKPIQTSEAMEVDEVKTNGVTAQPATEATITITPADQSNLNEKDASQKTLSESTKEEKETVLDLDSLYSVFWSLQNYFSQPTQLFAPENLNLFKDGLEATILKFKEVQKDQDSRAGVKSPDEPKQGTKRKRQADEQELVGELNPKYLTSRDLFALEITDLAFRRHILVQALIIIEFLLSLTPKAKAKFEHPIRNKAVAYHFVLPDEETQWAQKTKQNITTYLQSGTEGKFYYRMVDTVLSRDKNWSYWKSENCPEFPRNPVPPSTFLSALASANDASTVKRMRMTAMNAFDVGFLAEADGSLLLDKLRDEARAKAPPLESFKDEFEKVDLDLEFPADDKEKQELEEKRRGMVWQALRVGSRERFRAFIDVDDGRNIKALFETPRVVVEAEAENGEKGDEGKGDVMETERPSVEREGKGDAEGEMDTLMFDARTPGDGTSEGGTEIPTTNGEQPTASNGEQPIAADAAPMETSLKAARNTQIAVTNAA